MFDASPPPFERFEQLWRNGKAEAPPDLRAFVTSCPPLDPQQLTDLILLDQLRRAQTQQPRRVEDYLADFPILQEHPEAVVDLAFSEFLRFAENDAAVDLDSFLARFPTCQAELKRQIAFHRSLVDSDEQTRDESANLAPPTATHPQIPGYEFLHEIGRGGLGVVYLARDTRLHRLVAIKMLLAGKFASEAVMRRLATEGEATARLQHPNIVQIYEVGRIDGHPYLVLEYLHGDTLASRLAGKPQSPKLAARWIQQVAIAVQFAHERGVLHRDLKPSNLLIHQPSMHPSDRKPAMRVPEMDPRSRVVNHTLSESLQIKVADFGLAKFLDDPASPTSNPATLTGDLVGTAAYMSPEQAQGQTSALTPATDIYSIGAIFYEMLTGRPPFVGVHPLEVIKQVVDEEPVNPSQLVRHIPRDLQTICLKCLEKNPARRYASCGEVASELQRFLSDQPIVARHASPLERTYRWCRRNPGTTSVAALVFTVLALIISLTSLYNVMLRNQLTLIKDANQRERELRQEAIRELWDSSMTQAESSHLTQEPGQRYQSLHVIRSAQELARNASLGPDAKNRMRDGIVSALSLPDFREVETYPVPAPTADRIFLTQLPQRIVFQEGRNSCSVFDPVTQAKLLEIQTPHPIRNLAITQDAEYLLVVHHDCDVYQLQPCDPQPILHLPKVGMWAFDPQGSSIIGTNQDGLLQQISLRQLSDIRTIGPSSNPAELALSPNHQRLAIRVKDIIQVMDLADQKLLLQVPAPFNVEFGTLHWHPDSRTLAIGPYAEGIALWNIDTGEKTRMFDELSGSVKFAFSQSGNWLLTYNAWRTELTLWNTGTGQRCLSRPGIRVHAIAADRKDGFHTLHVDGDGLATSTDIEAPFICTSLPSRLYTDASSFNVSVAFSPDGSLLAVGNEQRLELYHTDSLACLSSVPVGISYLQFKPDNSLLSLSRLGLHHWPLRTVDDASAPSSASLAYGPPTFVTQAWDFAPFVYCEQRDAIAVPEGNGAFVWSLAKNQRLLTTQRHIDVRRVSLTDDGKWLATGGWNGGNACLWDLDSGQLRHTIPTHFPTLVQLSPNGESLAVAADTIRVWNTETWQLRYQIAVPGMSNSGVCIEFSRDGKCLAVSDALGRIHLLDAETGQEFGRLKCDPHTQVVDMKFNPRGTQIATITSDGMIHLWFLNRIRQALIEQDLPWTLANGQPPTLGSTLTPTPTTAFTIPNQSITIQIDEPFRNLQLANLLRRSNSSLKAGNLHATKVALDQAFALQPTDPASLNTLAWILATGPIPIRDPQRACSLAERAVKPPAPNLATEVVYRNTYAVALYRLQRYALAKPLFEENVRQAIPESLVFDLYFLAMCQAQLDDFPQARKTLEQAKVEATRFRRNNSFELNFEVEEFAREAEILLQAAPPSDDEASSDFPSSQTQPAHTDPAETDPTETDLS